MVRMFRLLLVSLFLTKITALNALNKCIECRSCRFFYDNYKCKVFATDDKYGKSVIYNYKLDAENTSFKYLSVLDARQNEKFCGKKADFFIPIIYKTGLKIIHNSL
tara:strand:- start:682 stop:999 length:318 start_codon:yes stop_codon:yes gene_type:complete